MNTSEKSRAFNLAEKLKFLKDNTLTVSKIFFVLAALALVLRTVCRISSNFADFFNRRIASCVRFVMTSATNILPFSLAEIIIMLLPFIFVAVIVLAVIFSKSKEKTARYIMLLLSIVALLYFLFVFTYATGFQTNTIDKAFDLQQNEVTVEELKDTAMWLSSEAGKLADESLFEEYNSKMPFSWKEMNKKLNSAFDSVNEKYGFLCNYYTSSKPVILSRAMSYTHTLGVYTFFTGEANINVSYPDYTALFTAAHEMSHQRGVARENEANFLAFIVCASSDDEYIRYCGYVNMLEYVMNALSTASSAEYGSVVASLSDPVLMEIMGYARVYKEYEDSPVGEISQTINDTYLKSQGTEGTKSYGMVVDLAVAYYKAQKSTAE
ncbi:MAG: DUF3810 domain-containing protein [Ruminococcaceae bacterium]|nr:DUF3810 domain-containing protein [Oscillospiraceae bacterium]